MGLIRMSFNSTAPRARGEGEQAERGDPLGAAVVKPPDAPRLK